MTIQNDNTTPGAPSSMDEGGRTLQSIKRREQLDRGEVERLIEAHQTAWLEFEASCPAADRLDPAFEGEEGIQRKDRLDEVEQAALFALLEYPAMGPASNRKATYLLTTMATPSGRWEASAETMSALLRSLLEVWS